jgi:mono/diheme cytochrome c family protein
MARCAGRHYLAARVLGKRFRTALAWGLRLSCGVCALAWGGCDRPPSADTLPEWSPADHHSRDDDRAEQRSARAAAPGANNDTQLVDLAWRQQCVSCHGPLGKGDGQMGPMVQAPDLSRREWQAKISDAEMADVIKNGRNRMPRFDLPEPVLHGLVARIRSLRGQ